MFISTCVNPFFELFVPGPNVSSSLLDTGVTHDTNWCPSLSLSVYISPACAQTCLALNHGGGSCELRHIGLCFFTFYICTQPCLGGNLDFLSKKELPGYFWYLSAMTVATLNLSPIVPETSHSLLTTTTTSQFLLSQWNMSSLPNWHIFLLTFTFSRWHILLNLVIPWPFLKVDI